MQYHAETTLNMDEAHILETQILPTAKKWVMNFGPSTSLFQNGVKILRYWNVKCPELRRRMQSFAETDRSRETET